MSQPSIVVVGSANTDLVVRVPRVPAPGETLLGGDLEVHAGGKGANQAVAAARLGARVTFIAALGRDTFGDRAIEGYEREGIDTRFIRRDPKRPSGAALVAVGADGQNAIVVAPGANAALTARDVDVAEKAIRTANVLLVQLETPLATVEHALRAARAAGVTTILNPAPAQPLSREILETIDWLTPNETEAATLAGIFVRDRSEAEMAARELADRGARRIVVTLGKDGVFALGTDGAARHVRAPLVKAVDTVAAGDAFNGAFAVALARGDDLDAALRFACAAGALSVTRKGAQPSLPTADEVAAFLAHGG